MNFDLTSLHAPAPLWAPTPPPIYHNKVGLERSISVLIAQMQVILWGKLAALILFMEHIVFKSVAYKTLNCFRTKGIKLCYLFFMKHLDINTKLEKFILCSSTFWCLGVLQIKFTFWNKTLNFYTPINSNLHFKKET